MGARNTTVAAQLDHAVIGRSEAALYNDLAERAKVRVDTRNDAFYAARTDRSILTQYKMDMNHVLAGEINARGAATGFHAEFAAGGAARIRPDAVITRYANGTYDAKVEIWDPTKSLWVEKRQQSTFFPPSWSQARIEYEITEAFKAGVPRTGFVGMSPGGIEIQFRWDAKNQRTTFYPLKGEK
jgi:hypothetical protein